MPFTISDSIALAILNPNALITGIGNELHLHTSENKTSKRVLPVTLRGKVHGIVYGTAISCNQLLVYGEKEYLVLNFTKEYSFETLDRGFITDWISAAVFLKEPDNIVLLSAHSTAVCLKYCPNKKKFEISQRSSCSEKSTLYSALIHGDQWSQLVCFGGNAYGELLIWRPTASKAPLIHRISSHNGVIFSINYSAAASMLTTTSDDRSIRFWRTGMQGTSEEWSKTKLIPVASGFGHLARVFQAKIIKFG